jgi:hypothetical protein
MKQKRIAMKLTSVTLYGMLAATLSAQSTFSVTGTLIPTALVQVNYGKLPNTIEAFDLNICNQSAEKHAVTASQIYQALAASSASLQPLGQQIMLGVILRNQRRSVATVMTVALNSAVGVLSVLGAARTGISANALAGAAVGSAVGQQLLNNLKPVLTPDQVERFESQVLESALVLDGGSCVERTVFTLVSPGAKNQFESLTFHVR